MHVCYQDMNKKGIEQFAYACFFTLACASFNIIFLAKWDAIVMYTHSKGKKEGGVGVLGNTYRKMRVVGSFHILYVNMV